jgi:predicted RNA-binding protein with PIN domain
MQKTYIIDGYNVLHASPALKRLLNTAGADRARGELLNAVAGFAERKNALCIVVFDGVVGVEEVTPKVRVVSSRSRTADEVIREQARLDGKRLAVVSSDLEIIQTARANMAEVIHSKAFAAELTTGTHSKGLAAPPSDGSARPHRIAELRERSEKPGGMSSDEVEEWKRLFGE